MTDEPRRRIAAIGGTVRLDSSSERAMKIAAGAAADEGIEVVTFDGAYLANLPHYRGPNWSPDHGREMLDAVRGADGVLIATPGYHGTISGMVKNAIDYFEELADDRRPYLEGRPVGLIATAFGHQAANSSINTLRTIVHSLRGWPTPFGAALKIDPGSFDQRGACLDPVIQDQLERVGRQVAQAAGRLS
jgi:FMN reductase